MQVVYVGWRGDCGGGRWPPLIVSRVSCRNLLSTGPRVEITSSVGFRGFQSQLQRCPFLRVIAVLMRVLVGTHLLYYLRKQGSLPSLATPHLGSFHHSKTNAKALEMEDSKRGFRSLTFPNIAPGSSWLDALCSLCHGQEGILWMWMVLASSLHFVPSAWCSWLECQLSSCFYGHHSKSE